MTEKKESMKKKIFYHEYQKKLKEIKRKLGKLERV